MAADALFLVDENFTVRALGDRLGGADLHAGGIVALLAGSTVIIDDVVFDVFTTKNLEEEDAGGNLVFFLAGDRAGLAPNAAIHLNNDAES